MLKADEWKEHIERCARSGQSVAEYCEGHGLAPKSMTWWRSELRRRERDGRTGHRPKVPKKSGTVARTRVPAVKLARVIRKAPQATESAEKLGGLRVMLAGAEIFVDGNCDRQLLSDLLGVLGRGGSQ